MGKVYRAWDERLGREVALKLLPGALRQDSGHTQRLLQEARAAGRLDHPGILTVHDVGMHEGQPYMVTELLEGHNLRSLLQGPLGLRKALAFSHQIALGLATAHEKGIVHRDIKPENLFLTTEGRLKILDFGLAKDEPDAQRDMLETAAKRSTSSGAVLGTVGYMSPEQAKGEPVDSRSDLFSFGVVLFEMLCGRRPFNGESVPEIMTAIIRSPTPDLRREVPDLPSEVAGLVERCLEKDPGQRFQSARDLASTLELFLGSGSHEVLGKKSKSMANRPWWGISKPWVLAVGVAVPLVVLAGVTFSNLLVRSVPSFQQVTFRRGTVYTARFLPKEEGIVYSAEWDGGVRELFSTVPGTVESRAMGMPSTDVCGNMALGEIQVLRRGGKGFSPGTLIRQPLAGGPGKELAEGISWADCLPGGNLQAHVRSLDGKVHLEFPAGKSIYQSPGRFTYPRISPQGSHVAFLEFVDASSETGDLVVMDRHGVRKVLSAGWKSIEGLAWRNTKEIWFCASSAGTGLWLHSCDLNGRVRLLCRVPGRLVLHDLRSDGKVLAERNSYRATLRCQVQGKPEEIDLGWLDFAEIAGLSPDGQRVLFTESGDGAGPRNAVFLRGTDGSPALRLGEGVALALSGDGRQALMLEEEGLRRLVIVPVGSGAPRPLPPGPLVSFRWAAFRPGNQGLVLFASEVGKSPRLYLQDLLGGLPRPLGPEGFTPCLGALDSSGAMLLGTLQGKAALLSLDTERDRSLDRISSELQPIGWVGKDAVFTKAIREGAQLFRSPGGLGMPQPWKRIEPSDRAGLFPVRRIALSADGRTLVYQTYRLLSDLYVIGNLD